jgi:hypothetical protein
MDIFDEAIAALDRARQALLDRNDELDSLRSEIDRLERDLATTRGESRYGLAPGLWIAAEGDGGQSMTRLSEVTEWSPEQLSAWLGAGRSVNAMAGAIVAARGAGASAHDLALAAIEAAIKVSEGGAA